MLYFAGIDIGSASSKAVILNEHKVLAAHLIETGPESRATARDVMNGVLNAAGLGMDDLTGVVATGYGRINVPFAGEVITEIACHAKGVHALFPRARTILDMGGQDCKAIRIDERGNHVAFAMNDKCAAGTGRFLEIMADYLRVPLAEIGPLSQTATEDTKISNVCTVFARSESARHLRRGVSKANILGGIHAATADRVYGLLKRVGLEADFVISGGIAKNIGVVRRVEARVGLPAHISEEPQIIGALGAAYFAREKLGGR
ncbi:MAG: 2-hydroxyglutaryl-CoA dehydratase [Proteobacteria bacterium]|nr:2-hydroxyglutaryl-CoA dehydratase [Pseudomonadota bacterium]